MAGLRCWLADGAGRRTGMGHGGQGEVEPLVHLQPERAVRVDVRPEERGQPAPILVRELLRPCQFGKNALKQQGVYLLTELLEEFAQFSGRPGKRVAMVPPR